MRGFILLDASLNGVPEAGNQRFGLVALVLISQIQSQFKFLMNTKAA